MKFNPNHAASTYQTPVPAYNGGGGGAAAGRVGGFEPCQAQVLSIFEGPMAAQSDTGLNVETLMKDLGNKFSRDQIKGAVDFLVNEGHLYSTIDDNHFKSTSC
eukprot:CAMPEP_0198209464 /NCGR_PEP_ID=MMETSP1445-20131203/16091_1 /TAXON_ID=36898 /ORGANISM="Pyramimonas sp., Strain CCMP2087" /LENGTH=102 /DNA_ID=CAMNT_0043883247 /DNA_START=22 /DNA_END=330 /DNA_ORIENTATION=+